MNPAILTQEVQDFIENNINADTSALALKIKEVAGVPVFDVISQIVSRKKALTKWPEWALVKGIYFPPAVSVEQSSSSLTAEFKSNLFKVDSVLDLTGGSGIDSYYFGKKAPRIVYVEQDKLLSEIASHNFRQVGSLHIEVVNDSAEEFLKQAPGFSLIYLDPSRRKDSGRVFQIEDCRPDLFEIMPMALQKAEIVMVKMSPLLDIKKTIKDLPGIFKVVVISVKNEVKELLFILKHKMEADVLVSAYNYTGKDWVEFEFHLSSEESAETGFSNPLEYIYEPNAAVLKSGGFKTICTQFDLLKLAPSTHLYTSSILREDFPGRVFSYLGEVKAKKNSIYEAIPDGRAGIFTRNYPVRADELKQKLHTKDSDKVFLVGTTLQNGKKVLLHLEKI